MKGGADRTGRSAQADPPQSGAGIARLRELLGKLLAVLAGTALIAMMLFTAADVVLRTIGRPVAGSFEVIGWLSAASMALALGYTQAHRGHVAMTLFSSRLGGRSALLVRALNDLIALGLFALASYHLFRYGSVLQSSGSLSETLRVVVYPWVYLVAAGCSALVVMLALDLAQTVIDSLPARASSS